MNECMFVAPFIKTVTVCDPRSIVVSLSFGMPSSHRGIDPMHRLTIADSRRSLFSAEFDGEQ